MLKRAFVAVAFLAAAAPSQAETRLGVVGGLSLAQWDTSPEDDTVSYETLTGFAGGAVLDVGLGSRFSLSFEPMYVRKGSELRAVAESFVFDPGDSASVRVDYLELPVMLKVRLGNGSVRPYLLAGPSAGYRLSAKGIFQGETTDAKDSFKEWDFSVTAGAGLDFPVGKASAFVEARYDLGLANVGEGTADNESVKNRSVLVLAGITFGIGGH